MTKIHDIDVTAAGRKFTEQAKVIVAKIAAERDKLRSLIEEYATILESVDEAQQLWEEALDKLSELL